MGFEKSIHKYEYQVIKSGSEQRLGKFCLCIFCVVVHQNRTIIFVVFFFISLHFRKMISNVRTLSSCHILTYIIIISALLCQNTTRSSRNKSYESMSSNKSYLFHLLNESLVFHPPVPLCEEPTLPKYIALATLSGAVMLLGLIGNLIVIIVIHYSQLRKQPGYVLIKSLAAADLGVSLFVTTTKVHSYQRNANFCSGFSLCVFLHVTDGLFPTASITHLLLISINKFCAVNIPFRYHALVTYSKENVAVLCIWFYSVLWAVAGMLTWETNPLFSLGVITIGINRHCYNLNEVYYVCTAICVFLIPVMVAGSLYVILVLIVIKKMHSTPTPTGKMEALEEDVILPCHAKQNYGSMKGAKTLMMVFAAWVVCWVPHFILVLVGYWNPSALHSFQENHIWWSDFISTLMSDVLPCINSCINPIIYLITSSIFRHSVKDSYLKLLKKPRHRAGSNPSCHTVIRYHPRVSQVSFLASS